MTEFLIGVAFVAVGLTVAFRALWQRDDPAVQFMVGMAIALIGGFVVIGQLFWRLIA